jgi:hypothetical protein
MTTTVISAEILQEWDMKLDIMETLFDACVELEEGCEEQLATVRKLRRQLRELLPFENVPIITDAEDVPR